MIGNSKYRVVFCTQNDLPDTFSNVTLGDNSRVVFINLDIDNILNSIRSHINLKGIKVRVYNSRPIRHKVSDSISYIVITNMSVTNIIYVFFTNKFFNSFKYSKFDTFNQYLVSIANVYKSIFNNIPIIHNIIYESILLDYIINRYNRDTKIVDNIHNSLVNGIRVPDIQVISECIPIFNKLIEEILDKIINNTRFSGKNINVYEYYSGNIYENRNILLYIMNIITKKNKKINLLLLHTNTSSNIIVYKHPKIVYKIPEIALLLLEYFKDYEFFVKGKENFVVISFYNKIEINKLIKNISDINKYI